MDRPAPTDDLFRGYFDHSVELRAETDADGSLMYGHLAKFNEWTEIDSWFEGRFIERLAHGAFKKTIRENRGAMRVTFDHGYDLQLNDKPLGPIDELREDDDGVYYEVPLLDTDYNRNFLLPTLQGRLMNGEQRGSDGLVGASFRFRVVREDWNEEPDRTDHNPDGLPERSINEVRLYEFGPVVYPAYEGATAKVRSLTDHYIERRLARTGAASRAAQRLAAVSPPPQGTDTPTPATPAVRHLTGPTGRDPRACLAQVEALRLAKPA
jgi:HK97 family phage prohead protease